MALYAAQTHSKLTERGKTSRRPAGLTLVELLVVLAIVSVLAALTFPVIKSGIVMTQRSYCISNMRQISVSLSLYSNDYDGTFPSYLADPLSKAEENPVDWYSRFCLGKHLKPHEPTWATLAFPYTPASTSVNLLDLPHTSDMFFCPADQDREARPITSYELKLWLAEGRTSSEIDDPTAMAMVWEQWAYHTDQKYSEHDRRAAMNIGFVDGHVRWVRLSETTSARYDDDPDLRYLFVGSGKASSYTGSDIVPW